MPWSSADWDWNVIPVPIDGEQGSGTSVCRCLYYGRPKHCQVLSASLRSWLVTGVEPNALSHRANRQNEHCGKYGNQSRIHNGSSLEKRRQVFVEEPAIEELSHLIVWLNVPPQTRKEDLLEACSPAGAIRWTFVEHDQSARAADLLENALEKRAQFFLRPCAPIAGRPLARGYVYFEAAAGAERMLNAPNVLERAALTRRMHFKLKYGLPVQLRGALQANNFLDWLWLQFQFEHPAALEVLEDECNRIMAAHERQLRKTALDTQRKRQLVDEDGFTRVVPRVRRRLHPNHAYSLAAYGASAPSRDASKPQQTTWDSGKTRAASEPKNAPAGFYRFQREEEKRQKLAELRAQFERDKQRLQHVRAVRQPFLS